MSNVMNISKAETRNYYAINIEVDLGDLESARKIAINLRNDEDFYLYCANYSKEAYKKYFSEEVFKTKIL